MAKKYDQKYFDKWYRGRTRVHAAGDLQRKVALALASAEYFLGRPLRTVLDVGCGEGLWEAELITHRPRLRYLGLDPSDYVVRRYGRERNLRRASFGDLKILRLPRPFDLVICSDVLHYVEDEEIRAGIKELAQLTAGVAYIEALTSDDHIEGDTEGFIHRPALWYRRLFREAGLKPAGPYLWLGPSMQETAAGLEVE